LDGIIQKQNKQQSKFSMMRPSSTVCMGIGQTQDADDAETKVRTAGIDHVFRFFLDI